LDEISALISQKLMTIDVIDHCGNFYTTSRAVTAFFPYAIWKERNGQPEMLYAFFHAVRALGRQQQPWRRGTWFMWHHIEPFVTTLVDNEGPLSVRQAIILASPYLPWWTFTNKNLVQLWAAAASAVPYTDEICWSVVDTLLHIASNSDLQPHIPIGMWQWLNKRPSLPPICAGRVRGSMQHVIQTIQGLRDVETLKSYLLLVWSEWDCLYSRFIEPIPGYGYKISEEDHCLKQDPPEMCTSIRGAFSGVEMGHHRKDLLQRLDHILGELDLGLDYLQQSKPRIEEIDIQLMKEQYGEIIEVLLEMDRKDN